MKKYIELKENNHGWNYLEVETRYNIGGYNYFTYTEQKRGYYLHVTPVKRDGLCISFEAFTGVKDLIKEVKRQSKKAAAEADAMAEERATDLIIYVLNKNGLQLAEV